MPETFRAESCLCDTIKCTVDLVIVHDKINTLKILGLSGAIAPNTKGGRSSHSLWSSVLASVSNNAEAPQSSTVLIVLAVSFETHNQNIMRLCLSTGTVCSLHCIPLFYSMSHLSVSQYGSCLQWLSQTTALHNSMHLRAATF